MTDIPKDLQKRADQAAVLQQQVAARAKALKEAQEQIDDTWDQVKEVMINNDVKSIKGDWGSITIADRTNYRAPALDEVPKKFIKKALDTTKVQAHKDLTGELPKGVAESHTKYLTKRIK